MRSKVLIVDDGEVNREVLKAILKKDYPILEADNGRSALEVLAEHKDEIAVILLDLNMPEMDGFQVLDEMKNQALFNKIPVLVISGENSVSVEKECFNYGVSDFIHKPFNKEIVKKRVKNVTDLFLYKNNLEEKVQQQTETLQEKNELLQKQAKRLQENNVRIIEVLATVVEGRDMESGEHVQRVKGYTELLARQMMKDYPEYGLTEKRINVITEASALHDVGKIAIPDNILLKPGRLTSEEFECMKTHTTKGSEILKKIDGCWDEEYGETSYEICRYHHEKYDGKGYPDGLKGDDIPLAAQIVSIADIYDALVSERVYKKAVPKDRAYEMIVTGECGVFSPKLLDSFSRVKADFEKLAVGAE